MGLLDFLFPAIMAAESRAKIKDAKLSRQIQDDYERSYQIYRQQVADVERQCTDINADMDALWTYENNGDDRYFVWNDFIKSLPSFEEDNPENEHILCSNHYIWCIASRYSLRMAVAKQFGKLTKKDCSVGNGLFSLPMKNRASWIGRERYDYESQLLHELMIEWDKSLQEHGFPYQLYVFNVFEVDPKIPTFQQAIPVAERPDYKGGHGYLFGFDYYKNYRYDGLTLFQW